MITPKDLKYKFAASRALTHAASTQHRRNPPLLALWLAKIAAESIVADGTLCCGSGPHHPGLALAGLVRGSPREIALSAASLYCEPDLPPADSITAKLRECASTQKLLWPAPAQPSVTCTDPPRQHQWYLTTWPHPWASCGTPQYRRALVCCPPRSH